MLWGCSRVLLTDTRFVVSPVLCFSTLTRYVDAFGKIAKKGNTVVLPANVGDPASMVAQAMAVFKTIGGTTGTPVCYVPAVS